MSFLRAICAIMVVLLPGAALAQNDDPAHADTVSWSVQSSSAAKQADRLKLTLSGTVRPGWHVYALKQAPDGPTPLLVTLDQNAVAAADGTVAGSPATTLHDPAFGLDTQFYTSAFSITVPVRLKPNLTGQQAIPLSLRFQTCNGRVCQPPRTVHFSAPVTLPASG